MARKAAHEYTAGTKRALIALGRSPDRPGSNRKPQAEAIQLCVAMTQKGTRCQRRARPGAKTCAQHGSEAQLQRRWKANPVSKPKKKKNKKIARSVWTVSGGGFESNRRRH
jgi:hypothetical protein